MKKVLVIGGATIDTIIAYENMETLEQRSINQTKRYLLLEEGKKIEVTSQRSSTGGGATNAAVSFLRQGLSVRLVCKVGRDLMGDQVKSELVGYGMDVSHIVKSEQSGTGSSFVVPSLSGDRTVFAYRGANTELVPADIPDSLLVEADFIYVTSLSQKSAAVLPILVSRANALHSRVAVNPGISQLKRGSSFLKSALSGIHTLILNYEEAQQLMLSLVHEDNHIREYLEANKASFDGNKLFDQMVRFQDVHFNLRQFFKEVLSLGPQVVAVTNGAEGVYVATPEHLYFQKSLSVNVVNTLGAGDAFGSAFVGSLFSGNSVEDSMRKGILNSLSVIGYPDAKEGLLTQAQLDTELSRRVLPEMERVSWG